MAMSGIMTIRSAARVFISSRMSRRPPDSLAVRSTGMDWLSRSTLLDRNGHGLFPAKPREGQHHGDVAQTRLELVERFGQAQHLGNAGDESLAAHRAAPAGPQLQRRINRDDSLFPCPGEQPPQNRRYRALGAA